MGFKKYKWHKVADREGDIKWTPGDIAEVEINGKKICIARAKEGWYGFANTCPHAGAPMIDGYVAGGCNVICPVHNLKFNLKNGRDTMEGGIPSRLTRWRFVRKGYLLVLKRAVCSNGFKRKKKHSNFLEISFLKR